MPIDNCPHSFSEMANQILPDLMKQMRQSIEKPVSIKNFLEKGKGVKSLLKQSALKADFKGCYVLLEKGIPIYVGISKQVFRRISLHCKGKTHFDANLVYSIAAKSSNTKMTRSDRMKDETFTLDFDKAKLRIQQCNFAYIPIDNDLTLYLFEAYCAMELDTCEWNTFRTH